MPMLSQLDQDVLKIAKRFRGRFQTDDLICRFQSAFPKIWRALELKYAPAGKNAGSFYSAASRIAHVLLKLANMQLIAKGKYVAAPAWWGSPVVRTWH